MTTALSLNMLGEAITLSLPVTRMGMRQLFHYLQWFAGSERVKQAQDPLAMFAGIEIKLLQNCEFFF